MMVSGVSFFVVAFFFCFVVLSKVAVVNTIKDFNAYAGKDIVLNCGITESNFKKIGWQINDANKPVVTYDLQSDLQYPLEILQQNLTGRVDISPKNVNQLRIKNLSLKDAGKYHCFIISNGAAIEKNTYNLQINAIPEQVNVQCFTDAIRKTEVSCASKDVNIKTIQCSVVSYPKSTLAVTEKPADCNKIIDTTECDNKVPATCELVLENACIGDYVCEAKFNDGVKGRVVTGDRVTIGSGAKEPGFNWLIFAIVVPLVLLVIFVIIIIVCIRCLKRTNETYGQSLQCPFICCNSRGNDSYEQKPRGPGTSQSQTIVQTTTITTSPDSAFACREIVPLKSLKVSATQPGNVNRDSKEVALTENEPDDIVNKRNERLQAREQMIIQVYNRNEDMLQANPLLANVDSILTTMGGTKYTLGVDKSGCRPISKRTDSELSLDELVGRTSHSAIEDSKNDK